MAQMKKILLVDDEEDLRDALAEQLLITREFLIEQAKQDLCRVWGGGLSGV